MYPAVFDEASDCRFKPRPRVDDQTRRMLTYTDIQTYNCKEKQKTKKNKEEMKIAVVRGSDFASRRELIFGEACPLKPRRHTD